MGQYDALTAAERARLERFGAWFESLHPEDYDLFLGRTASDDEIAAARGTALAVLGGQARRDAAARALASFSDAAQRNISRAMPVPEVMLTPRPGGTSRDRAEFLRSLERAAAAAMLWDELPELEREVLAGPWLQSLERALGVGVAVGDGVTASRPVD